MYFSRSYVEARDRFRSSVVGAGAALTTLPISAVGPAGEPLSIDVAWCGRDSTNRILMHTSGVHGVEGFCGSAIQLQWLDTHGPQHIPPDVAVVLVHVLNPYGMAWQRRVNEHNVDLNRNWLNPGEEYGGAPTHYDAVDEFLNGARALGAVHFYLSAARLMRKFGLPALRHMIASGQYVNPEGLFFGGSQLEEGPALLSAFLHARLSQVTRLVALDVHTGLGAYGRDVLLATESAGSASLERLEQAFGDRVLTPDAAAGPAWVSRGLYIRMLRDAAPRAEIDAVIQEFGTFSPLRVLRALRAENWQHHHGSRQAKRRLAEVFNPPDPEWRRGVLVGGRRAIDQAIRSLAVLP